LSGDGVEEEEDELDIRKVVKGKNLGGRGIWVLWCNVVCSVPQVGRYGTVVESPNRPRKERIESARKGSKAQGRPADGGKGCLSLSVQLSRVESSWKKWIWFGG
jgi:hypothetical protein